MATNKLMEAAADILAGSKKSATGMPSQKAEAEVVDLGGPTNQNSKPMDDSAKIDAAKAVKGKAVAPTTKPSDASSKMEELETEEEIIAEKMHDDEKKEEMKKKMKEDVDALFADDSTISEEFKSKVSTIFEARVADRVSQIEEETEAKYAGMLEEAVESIRADLTEKVDDYLSYVVEQWMKDNEIAIESGLRSELTEDFIAGMRNLFAEHYTKSLKKKRQRKSLMTHSLLQYLKPFLKQKFN
jgi:membrane-associated HD superfamily phosphohydrolase